MELLFRIGFKTSKTWKPKENLNSGYLAGCWNIQTPLSFIAAPEGEN